MLYISEILLHSDTRALHDWGRKSRPISHFLINRNVRKTVTMSAMYSVAANVIYRELYDMLFWVVSRDIRQNSLSCVDH